MTTLLQYMLKKEVKVITSAGRELAQEGIYKGTGVVRDGIVVTSGICPSRARDRRMPDGTGKLVDVFIEMLSENKTE